MQKAGKNMKGTAARVLQQHNEDPGGRYFGDVLKSSPAGLL